MRSNPIQTNFTSGEVSPLLRGRVDVNKYQNGARTLQNMLVRPQGGVCRRPGTRFIGACKNGTYTRVVPFTVSDTVAYVLEFGNLYVRFYTNGGQVVDGGSVPIEVATPYLTAELDQLYFAQSADVLFIGHPSHAPRMLTRTSNLVWALTVYVAMDGPYLDADTSGTKAQITLVSDITTMTSQFVPSTSVTATASGGTPFSAGSVGKFLLNPASVTTQPLLLVTAYTSTTLVTCQYIDQSLIIATGAAQLGASGGTISSDLAVFTSAMVNSYVYSNVGFNQGWYKITAYITNKSVSATAISLVTIGGGVTITISGLGAFLSGSVASFVEYIVGGVYYLAFILTVVSPTQATVKLLDDRMFVNDGSLDITIGAGAAGASVNVTSSYSGVFTQDDVGKFVRDTKSQNWVKITAWTNSSTVVGTVLLVFPYIYPTATMLLRDDRAITVTALFSAATLSIADVGRVIRFQFASKWRCMTITSVTSPTFATGTFNAFVPRDLINSSNFYNNGWADNFRLGAWSSVLGFPAIVGFHSQRLVWANTAHQPGTLWFSQPADYLNMGPTELDGQVIDTNAITVTLASGNTNPISWIRTGQVLLIGTTGGEHKIVPAGVGGISPTNIEQTLESDYGSLTSTRAFRFGVATLFLQRGGNKVREMVYQFQYDSFNSKDISVISEHIMRTRSGSRSMECQVDPVSVVWIVCNNGELVSCTYDRDQDIVAFAGHTISGGVVESIAVVPNTNRDDVYIVVRRTINSATVRYVELLTPLFDTVTGDTLNTMNFLDSSLYYSGAPASVVTGLSHMEGQSIYAIANGLVVGPFTVVGGSITLPSAASTIRVGLNYTSTLETLSPDGQSPLGTSQGKRKTIKEVTARVVDSMPFKHGPDSSHLTLIDAANFGGDLLPTSSQNQLTTGDIRFSTDISWDTQAYLSIVQNMPYPLTLEALMPTMVVNE